MDSGTPSHRTRTRTPRRIRVARTIHADPASTALLLAGPAALDLWPGVRRVADVGGRVLVEAALDTSLAAAAVRALPPRRTPTSFVTRFAFVGPGLPDTDGELVLSYVAGEAGVPATHASLVLDAHDLENSRLRAAVLTEMATGFLDNLAVAAEGRSRAA